MLIKLTSKWEAFTLFLRDFPGGPGVKNLPYNAVDMASILGLGAEIPHAEEQLSL